MVLLARASQNHDFTYIGKLPKLWFCLPRRHSKTMISLTLASYQIYCFACHGIAKLWFYLHWQATKSMALLAKALQNYDFTYIGKLPNLWFCYSGHRKTMILLTLASYRIYAFACHGIAKLWFHLHWQATESMVLLAKTQQTTILLTLASYQIFGFGCQGVAKLWSYLHWQATNLWFCMPGHGKTMILLTLASYQIYGFVARA